MGPGHVVLPAAFLSAPQGVGSHPITEAGRSSKISTGRKNLIRVAECLQRASSAPPPWRLLPESIPKSTVVRFAFTLSSPVRLGSTPRVNGLEKVGLHPDW